MNRPLLGAAGLMVLTALVHLFLGGPDVHAPMLALTEGSELAIYVSVLWHGISAVLILTALAFALAARDVGRNWLAVALAGGLSLAMAAVFFGYGLVYVRSIWIAPQWVVFVAIAGLALWGAARHRSN